MTDTDIAAIAGRLTADEEAALLSIEPNTVTNASKIDSMAGESLFQIGLITKIEAAGYGFTDLTDLGIALRNHLQEQPK